MKSIITYLFEKQNPFNVWIMCGLPGSGKSTYIKENLPKNVNVISQDNIRQEMGIMKNSDDKAIGTQEQEKKVTQTCFNRIDKAVKDRKDFVIDNTNNNSNRVQNFYDRFTKAGANVKIIIIDTPKEICKKRRNSCIPKEIIDQMQIGFDKVKQTFKNHKDAQIIKTSY